MKVNWLCNMCSAEFRFTAISIIDKKDTQKVDPNFCPYCGRENKVLAEHRTAFKKIEVLDAEELQKLLKKDEEESTSGTCV
jgi:glutaredoxin